VNDDRVPGTVLFYTGMRVCVLWESIALRITSNSFSNQKIWKKLLKQPKFFFFFNEKRFFRGFFHGKLWFCLVLFVKTLWFFLGFFVTQPWFEIPKSGNCLVLWGAVRVETLLGNSLTANCNDSAIARIRLDLRRPFQFPECSRSPFRL